MINTIVPLETIDFEEEMPSQELVDSIRKRGIAIAVHVNCNEGRYTCIDGRKRLTACKILAREDSSFARIPVVLMNDYSKAGSAFWGNTQNHH